MKTRDSNPDLYALARPIDQRFIEPPPTGKYGDYVPHFVIRQMLLAICGPHDWEIVEVLRGNVPGYTSRKGEVIRPLENAVVGAICRLTVTIDGQQVTIEEVGECDSQAHETNDGMRLKKASSDALKRCAMAIGLGIQLWCKRPEQVVLHDVMTRAADFAANAHDQAHVSGQAEDEEPSPPSPPAASEEEPIAEVRQLTAVADEPDEADLYLELAALVDTDLELVLRKTNKDMEAWVRRVIALAEVVLGFPEDSFHRLLRKHEDLAHWSELRRKENMQRFTTTIHGGMTKALNEFRNPTDDEGDNDDG